MTQLHEAELELEGKRSNCRQLEQENQLLCGSIEDLKAQQVSLGTDHGKWFMQFGVCFMNVFLFWSQVKTGYVSYLHLQQRRLGEVEHFCSVLCFPS